jgi:prepilin-type processing-associated H-X9-DG protein
VPISWQTQILPFIEQDALWRGVVDAYRADPSGQSPEHARIRSAVVPLFLCPAEARTLGWIYPEYPWGLTSYLGVAGTSIADDDGVFHENVSFRLTDITDGTSNTLMIGERPPGPRGDRSGWYGTPGWSPCPLSQVLGVAHAYGPPDNAVDCLPPVNAFRPGRIDDLCDVIHFWSLHPGGAMFAFADGHVRFIPYSAGKLLPALATRAGGEVVSLD